MVITFRNDDVSPNTDFKELAKIYDEILKIFPDAKIVSGVTLFSKSKVSTAWRDRSPYDGESPFKNNPKKWFYDVDSFWELPDIDLHSVASHGLIHADHSKLGYDAQEMSILSSCNILKTKSFIPPFNRFNEDTINICESNGIKMLHNNFLSFEYEDFNEKHKDWYFHSWRWTPKKIRNFLNQKTQHLR